MFLRGSVEGRGGFEGRGGMMKIVGLAWICAFAGLPGATGGASPGGIGTLEDIYGDTGNGFQGAIGFINFEGFPGPAQQSYGIALDDMVVEWKELTFDPDQTTCASGSCAVLELPTVNLFQGTDILEVSLLERTPWGSACVGGANDGLACFPAAPSCPGGSCLPVSNDCDLDGSFDGPLDDDDCNDNAVSDVVVRATSEADTTGVILVLDRQGPFSPEFRANLAVSVVAGSPGTLFLAPIGDDAPTVTVTYRDLEDGTGHLCQNSVVPEQQGLVTAAATVLIPSCDIRLVSTSFVDNGDGDSYADTDETIAVSFGVQNLCGYDLTGCRARLATASPLVECIQTPVVTLGTLPFDSELPPVQAPGEFVFKISSAADRGLLGLGPLDPLSASFTVSFACNEIDAGSFPQGFDLSLDLDISDLGQSPFEWKEGFESGTLGTFAADNLDEGISGNSNVEGLANADGWRCQYSDPDWVNGNAYGDDAALDCYPTYHLAHANAVFWQVDGSSAPHVGPKRAYRGTHSMYYGVFLTNPAGEFTTPIAAVESASTTAPINLGVHDPKLSFWQQVTLVDHRFAAPLPPFRSVDRGVVQLQLADESGNPAGDWTNLQPIQNAYDEQGGDNFFSCHFDPIDDGSTEDDFFDPTDPDRDDGPSSTCFPGFSYGWHGDTDDPFNVSNIGNSTTPPAASDAPSLGPGTWVETVVDLSEFRGRRARFRFLVTSCKATQENWELQFEANPTPEEDGWWIDDVAVDEALANPAQIQNDAWDLGSCSGSGAACIARCGFSGAPCSVLAPCGIGAGDCIAPCPVGEFCSDPAPGCGPDCAFVQARVTAETTTQSLVNPAAIHTAAPGQVVAFDAADPAAPSFADACLGGVLQYRFCISQDPDGGGASLADDDCDDVDPFHLFTEDEILRGWTEDPSLTVAPQASATYVTEVRCSTDITCEDTQRIDVVVDCPGGVNAIGLADLRAVNKTTIQWAPPGLAVDWLRGSFAISADVGDYVADFTGLTPLATTIPMAGVPAPGTGWYYLVKADGPLNTIPSGYYCNSRTWRSGGPGERAEPARDAAFGDP